MATLTLKQVDLAKGLVGEGYQLKEFNTENVLKLTKDKKTINISQPKKKKKGACYPPQKAIYFKPTLNKTRPTSSLIKNENKKGHN